MAKLGGGVDELKVDLLQGPPFGLHQQGLQAKRGGLVTNSRAFLCLILVHRLPQRTGNLHQPLPQPLQAGCFPKDLVLLPP